MYFSLPLVGALLAVITYLVLRGGLTSTLASSADVNPYGFVAVAALVGLFSREAADKLHAIFEAILTPAEQGRDPAIKPSIDDADRRSGGVGTNVRLTGTGLSSATSVAIGAASTQAIDKVSDTELAFAVPDGATTGRIIVTGPSGIATSSFDFNVG
jgi:IPT/TIG domain